MPEAPAKYLVVIAGPTASGKTSCAIEIAQHFQTEIISCDSRQLYKEISIGTAKPTADELAQAPHHFIDHLSIHDEFDAGTFEKEVNAKLEQLFGKHDVVVMAGGTGLFIRAVVEGLDELPDKSEALRKTWQQKFENEGITALQDELKKLDPAKFEQMDSSNPQRLIRAIEICVLSGKTHAELQTASKKDRPYNVIGIALDLDRELLYERINLRVDQMMEMGLLEEVKRVYPHKQLNSLKTVGYSELFEYLDGDCELEFAVEKIKQHSRNYAKRQVTWFKKMDLRWFAPENVNGMLEHIQQSMQ